jgi:hypothetical protein
MIASDDVDAASLQTTGGSQCCAHTRASLKQKKIILSSTNTYHKRLSKTTAEIKARYTTRRHSCTCVLRSSAGQLLGAYQYVQRSRPCNAADRIDQTPRCWYNHWCIWSPYCSRKSNSQARYYSSVSEVPACPTSSTNEDGSRACVRSTTHRK